MRRTATGDSALVGRLLPVLVLLLAVPAAAHADWTATGIFRYIDRPFDETGFLMFTPPLPIRHATVEVRDAAFPDSSFLEIVELKPGERFPIQEFIERTQAVLLAAAD